MKLSIDVRMLEASGIGTYLSNLLPLIIDKLPHNFFYLLGNQEKLAAWPWAERPNVKIIDCRTPIYSIAEQFELVRKTPADTDLFWSPHFNIPVFYRGNLIVTVHDMFHFAMRKGIGGLHKYLYSRLIFAAIKHKARAVLSVSQFTKSELVRFVGIDPGLVHWSHLGVGAEWFAIEKKRRPHDRPYILYVGNVKPHKNLVRLLRAVAGIAGQIPHDLVIVGKKEGFITGDEEAKRVANAQIPGRVFFTGHVSPEKLKQYYAFAETLILPSLYEGFGLPPVEAMACGCPVIVAKAASLPEVCGDAALYCDPYSSQDIAEKIKTMVENEELRSILRKKGLERAKRYSWERCAAATAQIIETALAK